MHRKKLLTILVIFVLILVNNICFAEEWREWAKKGNDYYRKFKWAEALECYNKSLAIHTTINNLFNRAFVYQYLGEYEKALNEWDEIIPLIPDNPYVYGNKAEVLIELGRTKEAINEFERALSHNPNEDAKLEYMGTIKYLSGEIEEAIEYYNKSLAIREGNYVLFLLGKTYCSQGEYGKAFIYYEKSCSKGEYKGCKAYEELENKLK
ncbi:MAG: tetratricopeptide repeat protein [Deltaproteobacteria bacterium]|uniref:Tetratricopeptide repeat protein n=1 Tax=Candidatus Zymogenus saltonus TaxID=2844893 RepID=A0A9D8PPJ6_9DELT|nr:tetratricopeptide repeat protein [Candidatus Zymogenus saltonus]